MHILRCIGWNLCVKFQRAPFKFHTTFWTHTPQHIHLFIFYFCVSDTISLNCDVISLSETGPCSAILAITVISSSFPGMQRVLWFILHGQEITNVKDQTRLNIDSAPAAVVGMFSWRCMFAKVMRPLSSTGEYLPRSITIACGPALFRE